ncbi:aldehyde dehydrogenase (NADP(+)) [Parafrankia elaeagni]|uniref:aldehyde dehydrogenase (NADP(+)) n=1 Tax=Parafrankia elaeagni TaxID=222534 RepID=UPI0003620F22|nr:aldehyde dehydrogenase (NADP(+)) [Parafrankia elaeagni]
MTTTAGAAGSVAAGLTGRMFIGAERVDGTGTEVHSVDPRTGRPLAPPSHHGTTTEVRRACALAEEAFDAYRNADPQRRAGFLERVADNLTALTDALVDRAGKETGLPPVRLAGEVVRTTNQFRLFADVLREGSWHGARIDPAEPGQAPPGQAPPGRTPPARPDLRQRRIPLGPVAVFGASNFPLAFSVAGGDTASALAAGCPVVVKAHDAHLGTSELAAGAIRAAVAEHALPDGVFSLLIGDGPTLGTELVVDPRIQAVGFTGSRAAGLALVRAAAARPRPIPVYAEMSSVNPVVLMPGALAAGGESLGRDFVASLTLGAGQFCTSPGLILGVDGLGLDVFVTTAARAVTSTTGAVMLTAGIARSYQAAVAATAARRGVTIVARGGAAAGAAGGQAVLMAVGGDDFLADPALQDEMFGPAALVVRCRDLAHLGTVVRSLEGQLTASVHAVGADLDDVRRLLPALELRAGRIIFDGWPTGVDVGHAVVHGGPFPATSDSRTTSVGSSAIERFLRPVAYQNAPGALLPGALRDDNPYRIPRRIGGKLLPG